MKPHFQKLDYRECKYIIPPKLVPEIREFIRPFCEPDPDGKGDPPEYMVTTLQLDTPDMALHRARLNDAAARFKLRARIYGEPGETPVFLEIKCKSKGAIMKMRARVPFEAWGEHLFRDTRMDLRFKSTNEENSLLTFVRLVNETGAAPTVLIRYIREAYFDRNDPYTRVTFDRRLVYQPTRSWDSWGRGGRWFVMDMPLAQDKNLSFSGAVLEVKTMNEAPHWIKDLATYFNLDKVGNCKYSSAIFQESLFDQITFAPYTAEDLFAGNG